MLSSSPGALLVLALFTGALQAAETPPIPRCSATSRIDLAAGSPAQAMEVCVSPDEPTTFVFDSRVVLGSVVFQPEGRLADWAPGQGGLSLHVIPRGNYLPGERVKLTVRFVDGSAPESASLWLVGHAAKGARRVDVFRKPHPADVLNQEKVEAQAEARQCQEDKARLLAEREAPGGLVGVAWLEREDPATSESIWSQLKQHAANALITEVARSYSHTGSAAVRIGLMNPGTEDWTAAGAMLKDSMGTEVELSTWQPSAIAPSKPGFVVVSAGLAPGQLGCPCTLKLWEAQGPRTVTLGNITFPPMPTPTPK